MKAFAFGASDRRMVAQFHPGQTTEPGTRGVLLCPPFGHEAIRAHRFYRVLADRLARQGDAVLRFDYYGTGDSAGDDLDGDLDGWREDVLAAHGELIARSRARSVAWVGIRLGAALAVLAAQRPAPALSGLVLWDPVTDGTAYLEHLRHRQEATVREALCPFMNSAEADRLVAEQSRGRGEALGFALSDRLLEQIGRFRLASIWPSLPVPCCIIAKPTDDDGKEAERLQAAMPNRSSFVRMEHDTDWTTDSAMNGSLLPGPALNELINRIRLGP